MNINELKKYWKSEEQKAQIIGWDFKYIESRFDCHENSLPWDYFQVINKYRRDTHKLLDIDTGGGEFLLTLKHPYHLTYATEGYPPNVELCRKTLSILGIKLYEMTNYASMPFSDKQFDIIVDRHGNYNAKEVFRILKPGGMFITQQVGENNDREFVTQLLPNARKSFEGHNLANCVDELKKAGFSIVESGEAYRPVRFYDTGALVWFARIIEWEFVGFSVDKCFDQLLDVEHKIKQNGSVDGKIHRFYIAAQAKYSDIDFKTNAKQK